MNARDVIDAVAAVQRANGWSDETVAKRIGIDRRQWNMARRHKRGLGERSLRGVALAFPELKKAVDGCFYGPSATQVERSVLSVTPQAVA